MYCWNCGKEIDDQAVICAHCGCAIEHQSEKNQTPVSAKGDKVSVLSILGFCLALVGWCVPSVGFYLEIVALLMSIVGVVIAKKTGRKLKGLGIAGIVISSIIISAMLILLIILSVWVKTAYELLLYIVFLMANY